MRPRSSNAYIRVSTNFFHTVNLIIFIILMDAIRGRVCLLYKFLLFCIAQLYYWSILWMTYFNIFNPSHTRIKFYHDVTENITCF